VGAPVVLVHGFSDQSNSWFLADPDLLEGYRVIAVDLPGHGSSDPWRGEKITIGDMAAEVDIVTKALGLERFSLIGHSMGGMVAQEFAVQHPRKLAGLFPCCTASRGDLLSGTAFNMGETKEAIRRDGIVAAMSADPYSAFAPGFESPLIQAYLEKEFLTDGETALKCLDAIKDWKLDEEKAKMYPGPTTIICGEMDRITPSSFAIETGRAFENSKVETIRGSGHLAFLEKPKEFSEILRKNLPGI